MKLGLQQRLYNAEVRSRRLQMGLTQKQLADKIGVHGHTVTMIECLHNMNPESEAVRKLAAFWAVEPEVLCPLWLKELHDVPKLVHTEKEVEREGLPFMRVLPGLPAPVDPAVESYDIEWLEMIAPKVLHPDEREAFFALLGTQKDVSDIARQLGCNKATVSSRINRAKEKLAKAWARKSKKAEL